MHLLEVRIPLQLSAPTQSEGAITDWLERALRLEGITVERLDSTSLHFRSSVADLSMVPASAGSLRALTSGVLEVAHGQHGLEITAHAAPRTWPLVLPFLGVGLISGILWNPEFRVLGAVTGLSLAGLAWLLGYRHLRATLRRIAANIEQSYREHPALTEPPA